MFDTDASASIYKGGMIRNKIQADQNAHAADSANRVAREWMEHAQALEAELAKTKALLKNKLMSEAGYEAGYLALREALKATAPNHPLVSDTGIRYEKSGRIKLGVHLVYEKAHDAKGIELQISNPKSRRTN